MSEDDAFAILSGNGRGRGPANVTVRRCLTCGLNASSSVQRCESCGGPLSVPEPRAYAVAAAQRPRQAPQRVQYTSDRVSNVNRTAYVVLALFLGGIGVHNFYAKRGGVGGAQIAFNVCLNLLVLLGGWTNTMALIVLALIGSVGFFVWIIVEIVTVTQDGDGYPMS